ncbi:uncharacterized protein B0I36DRAFT_344488 [Microdochium trichocladiopsis]|uniref:Vacuolar membrane protein n=1 Tax=Microdochium trichocladiopsis TaxID=1682393 RepID=A0A9P8YKR3_9PEZI|nr:uncharacterized protein B0I36DRAFT_344488 [Microdochium trichocladiopsis]KAH7040809.1 hypothetical protein B0I36DRAFT_344488 [Microdochium trichocladiopsis]
MGCFGGRAPVQPRPEQTWDAITLKDFKSKSFWNGTAFAYLYFSVILSIAVYGVDIFTAVNLLAFDTWSSQIKPVIDRNISKWVFSICIILSVVNLIYEFIVAVRVIRRGNVAECYLDNLAVRMESLRWGKGQGWRRFLVFSALTKSKKGAEYIALFTYFSFQYQEFDCTILPSERMELMIPPAVAWFRVIFCSGPRQVINATTLYSVYNAKLNPTDLSSVESTLETFFAKLRLLYIENNMQAVILSGMLFTLVIWVFTTLFLIMAVLFHIFFLWHWIPKGDGGLQGYCERKINKRLLKIVSKKMNKAIMREEERQRKADAKALKAGTQPPVTRQATLPQFLDEGSDDKLPQMPSMTRKNTMTTLPQYQSRAPSPSIEMNSMDQKKPYPLNRNGTTTTVSSGYAGSVASARTPLVGAAAQMGRSASPTPSIPQLPPNAAYGNYPPPRPSTANSNRTGGPSVVSEWEDPYMARSASPAPTLPILPPVAGVNNYPPPARTGTSHSMRGPGPAPSVMSEWDMPGRAPSVAPSVARSYATAPSTFAGAEPMAPFPPRITSPAPSANGDPYGRPMPRAVAQLSGRPGMPGPPGRFMPEDQRSMMEGRASPAPSSIYSEAPGMAAPGARYNGPGYPPPARSNTAGPMRPGYGPVPTPQRNMTAPMPPRLPLDPYSRQGTPGGAQSAYSAYDDDVESQRGQRW